MTLILDGDLRARIVVQLEASYPNEAGGFLLGSLDGEDARVVDTVAVDNVFAAEEQYHRYAMTPADWTALEDRADALGLALVGYYHSHPDSPAIPSDYDRDHAWPNFRYLITSVENRGAAHMRVWRLAPDRAAFAEEPLAVAGQGGGAL